MDRDSQPLGKGIKTVFVVVGVLTLVVGLALYLAPDPAGIGSQRLPAWPARDQWWPWPLWEEYTTRFFGALFVGVGVGALWAARQQRWGQVRALFPPGLTFTALATISAMISFDALDKQRLVTWLFFGLYLSVLVVGGLTFYRYERRQG